jgi:general secretion pathway protein A
VYEAFFSLEDSPFVLTPDPRFLLRSKGHHEVLATLLYGITSQKGLMALIGDVGTGKTTLCRALLRELPREVQSALVLNPHLSDTELLGTILDDLGAERRGATKGELMTTLSQHLLAAGADGKTVVVLLDEAQQMTVEALEQIRILSTLETATRKLLQIVLVGQPELEEKLRRHELRQLDQRVGVRCYLRPLSRKDTFRYVEHRLRIAGLPGALPFTRNALARVYRYSGGIPRVINMVCDRALMAAYSARARQVTPALVRTAIRNLRGEGRRRSWRARVLGPLAGVRRLAVPVGAAALVLLAAGGLAASWSLWGPPALDLVARMGDSRGAVESGYEPAPSPPAQVALAPSGQESAPSAREAARPVPAAAPPPATATPAAVSAPAPTQAAPTPPAVLAPPPATRLGALAPAAPPPPVVRQGLAAVLARAMRLWGIQEDVSEAVVRTWPTDGAGALDLVAIAARYQLSATALPETSLEEVRAIGLPAIVEVGEGAARQPYLLRRLDAASATLIGADGREARVPLERLERLWTRSAWFVWRNVDLLPADPFQEMTPTVIATLALRLQKLGHLAPPLPGSNNERFQQAVRRFQRAMGLREDGIVGPRTTLALARVVGGRFSPTLEPASQ